MKKFFFITILLFTLTLVRADDLQEFQGKWTTETKNKDGQTIKQTLEFNKNKMVFKIHNADGDVRFVAESEIELKKAGAFKTMVLGNLRAGRSSSDLSDVSEDYQLIYILTDDGLAIATNFDKPREGRKPTVEIYTKTSK
jgi:hypothetical protein